MNRYFENKISKILMALFLVIMIVGMFIYGHNNGVDFSVYYLSGQRFLHHITIYQWDDGSPFKYHPAWAVFFSLFSFLPYGIANVLFNALNFFFWVSTVIIWSRWLNIKLSLMAWTFLLVISINSFSTEIGFGQLNGFLIWGVTWLFQQIDKNPKDYLRIGILATLLVTLKLNYGVILIYLLLRQWRTIWGLGVGFILLNAITIIGFHELWPLNLYNEWFGMLFMQSAGQYNTYEVQGVFRFLLRHFDITIARQLWATLLILALGFGWYSSRNHKFFNPDMTEDFQRAMNAAYWLALIFIFSPLTWWYHVLFLYPMIFVLLQASLPKIFKIPVVMILAIFALVSYNSVGAKNIIYIKDSMVFFFSGVLLIGFFFAAKIYWRYYESLISIEKTKQKAYIIPNTEN